MRFDDTFDTVLAADLSHEFGRQSAWRQLVDLVARRRVPADARTIAMLTDLHRQMPEPVRAAGGRMLDHADPPLALVRLFATDEPIIAMPVLRSVDLPIEDWIQLLPELSPVGRAVLRHRPDLDDQVRTALSAFGSTDFVLADERSESAESAMGPGSGASRPDSVELPRSPFTSVGAIARNLPLIAREPTDDAAADAEPVEPAAGPFRISDIVARIRAYQDRRERGAAEETTERPLRPAAGEFRFETDGDDVIRWVEGVERAPLIGLSLRHPAPADGTGVDGVVVGAVHRRAPFSDARLQIAGSLPEAGHWLISGVPVFDRGTGRFTGYRGNARRPRIDERADDGHGREPGRLETLRELVHELRTPAGAILGFAEMIEGEILGPVPIVYRERAQAIRANARDLIAVIDDLDLAARMEARALDLRPGVVAVRPLLAMIVRDLAPLASLRAAGFMLPDRDLRVAGDQRAVERLLARLLATLLAAARPDDQLAIALSAESGRDALITIDRPAELRLDGEDERGATGLGEDGLVSTGFAIRLVSNLAGELGGALQIDARRLTLRLPLAEDAGMEQATSR